MSPSLLFFVFFPAFVCQSKFVLQMLADEQLSNIEVLGSSSEKFKSITTRDFYFKDSINFLNFSLSNLVDNLKNKAKKDEDYRVFFPATFSLLKDRYSSTDAGPDNDLKRLKMLIRKQPYPYVSPLARHTD